MIFSDFPEKIQQTAKEYQVPLSLIALNHSSSHKVPIFTQY